MKKILYFILTAALLLGIFCTAAAALETSEEGANPDILADVTSDVAASEESIEGDENPYDRDEPSAEDNAEGTELKADEENVFSLAFSAFEEYSAELFSALAFIGSLIIMLAYKRGFLPLIKSGIGAISSGVKGLEEQSRRQSDESEAMETLLSRALAKAENVLEGISSSVSTLEQRLTKAELNSADSRTIFTVIYSEAELLLEILMASSLPQYEKERVIEKISKMKSLLPIEDIG